MLMPLWGARIADASSHGARSERLAHSLSTQGGLMRGNLHTLAALLLLAGCAQLPPNPADLQAKRFEPVPDKAVIYVVRQPMDSREPGGLMLENGEQVTTLRGTYWRWEVAPGRHRIMNFGPGHASVELDTEPGRIYFVRHTVIGTPRTGPLITALAPISEEQGRRLVASSELIR
jgi:hypothetical protein